MEEFTEDLWLDIERHLHPEACSFGDLFFVSPYLTGSRLRHFLEHKEVKCATVILQLIPSNVASGSVDVSEIRSLLEIATVISLGDLHAKIVIDQAFVFVGSQNLTLGGEFKNTEATLLTDNPEVHNDILLYVRELASRGTRVTETMLDRVESQAQSLIQEIATIEKVDTNFDNELSGKNGNVINLLERLNEQQSSAVSHSKELVLRNRKSGNHRYWTMVRKKVLMICQTGRDIQRRCV